MLSVLLGCWPACAAGAPLHVPGIAGDDALVLLAVRLGKTQLSDALPAQEFDGELYLPLSGLAKLLSLAIDANPSSATASGFIIEPERSFYLDARAGTVTLAGATEPFDLRDVRIGTDDIYVARRLIISWLPIDLEVDLPSLWLLVHPREQLPLQALQLRERRADNVAGNAPPIRTGFARREAPYAWAELPMLDQTFAVDVSSADGALRNTGRLTTFAAADFLQFEGTAFLTAGSGGDPLSARLTLSRHDPDNGMLGFAHASSVSFGSVPMAGVANVSDASSTGAGFRVSNYPLTRPERFDTQSLNGPLPPGWDVELYYNDALLGWRQADASGTYDFRDLPLQYGRNRFRLMFRGPQGQFREEEQIFQVGESLVPAGELYYNLVAQPWTEQGIASSMQLDWGLGSHLSLASGMTLLHGDDAPFMSVGLRGAVAGSFVTADMLRSPSGDWASEFGLRTRLGGYGVSLTHRQLENFSSDLYRQRGEVRAQSELRVNGALPLFGSRFPLDLELRRDDNVHDDRLQANLRLSALFGGVSVSNQLGWQSTGEQEKFAGRLQLSRRFERFGLRAQFNYDAQGSDIIDDVAISFDQRNASGWLWSLGFERSIAGRTSSLNTSLNRSFESFSLGLRGSWSTDDVFVLGMNLFMSLGREPRSGTWRAASTPVADSGALSARVFLDSNLNGALDADEAPLPDVAFQVNGGRQQARTGADGVVLLQRLPINQLVDIGVESGTLEDPYWLPRPGGVRVVPRPGAVLSVDFPVVPTTEIDGLLYAQSADAQQGDSGRPLAGRRVELRAADGTLITSTTSASDGYYVLEAVPPGEWQLLVVAAEGETAPPPRMLRVDPSGALINAIDFVFTVPGDASTLARVDRAARVVAAAAASQSPPAAATIAMDPAGSFAVQTGAFMSMTNAERYAAAVAALGFEPRIEPFLDANKVRWYRVRVGRLDGLGRVLAATETMRAKVSEAAIPVRLKQPH